MTRNARKNINVDRCSKPKQDARKGRKEVFALYVFHFKRFRGVTKIDEKMTSKCHEQTIKNDALGTIWRDSWEVFLGRSWNSYILYNFFDRSKNRLNLQQNQNEAKAIPRGARVHCWGLKVDPGKVYWALRGVPLLATSSRSYLAAGRPRNLAFLTPISRTTVDNTLVTFWPRKIQ